MVCCGGWRYETMHTVTEETKLVERVVEQAWNKGNMEVVDEVIADGYVMHTQMLPQDVRGPEGFKEMVQMWRSAFPDFEMTIEDRVVEGERIVHHFTMHGTHEGEFMGIEPTGNEIEVETISIHTFEDGEAVADFAVLDSLGLMTQLDAVEWPENM